MPALLLHTLKICATSDLLAALALIITGYYTLCSNASFSYLYILSVDELVAESFMKMKVVGVEKTPRIS
jgi:hypothetical protein